MPTCAGFRAVVRALFGPYKCIDVDGGLNPFKFPSWGGRAFAVTAHSCGYSCTRQHWMGVDGGWVWIGEG